MSTYSTNLGIELIGTGEQDGTWGTTTNTNLGTLIEQAISGYTTYACTGGTDTITIPNGASGTARNMFLELTAVGGGTLVVPANKKLYFIYNNTASAITVKVSGQTGVSVPNGAKVVLVSNGTDVINATNYLASLTLGSALPVASGGTGQVTANAAFNALAPSQSGASGKYLKSDGTNTSWDAIDISTADITGVLALVNGGTGSSTASGARTNLGLGTLATANTINNDNWSGTDLSLANGGTGASDAATARTNLGLGTVATQNSNAVSITGGSISGITDLAVADGGTGSSTASGARTNLGLGTLATASTISNDNWSGTDLSVANGGTGASDAATARTNLGAYAASNPAGYTTNTGTVTSVSGTGSYGGLTLSGSVTTSGSLTLGGTPTGTWPISISGSAASATSATNATNATYATNPASGGSFITSSNIGSQSVNYATSAGSASTATSATSATSATNATNATNATYATTQSAGTNNTTIATTAFVQTQLSTLNAVGSIAFLYYGNAFTAGSTYTGLTYSAIEYDSDSGRWGANTGGSAVSGTWKALGSSSGSAGAVGLFVRVS